MIISLARAVSWTTTYSCCARQRWSRDERADVCAANLHTLDVANVHYVNEQVAADAGDLGRRGGPPGDFIRGLGKRTALLPFFVRCIMFNLTVLFLL